ncbi:MAG TPA: hypothetical protein VLK85_22170 [Ramlibacter sp.]|nr:hypothetical protein [Ramlibacter sp.]
MRRWLLLLIVALLPLRGWVADAMAGQMLQQFAVAASATEAPANPHEHADCLGHAGTHDHAAAAEQEPDDCATCAHCQACSSVALQPAGVAPALARLTHAAPVSPEHVVHSTVPARALKPPIS